MKSLLEDVAVTPVAGSLGAEVDGLPLRDLSDEGFAVLHQALLDHQVLFVRGQHLTEQEHLDQWQVEQIKRGVALSDLAPMPMDDGKPSARN